MQPVKAHQLVVLPAALLQAAVPGGHCWRLPLWQAEISDLPFEQSDSQRMQLIPHT